MLDLSFSLKKSSGTGILGLFNKLCMRKVAEERVIMLKTGHKPIRSTKFVQRLLLSWVVSVVRGHS